MMGDLTQVELMEHLNYCHESGIFTRIIAKSRNVKVGDIAGSNDGCGYLQIRVIKKQYLAHRLAWLYVYGEWPKKDIDHINGIRKDNRISNLREATHSQNMHNQHCAQINNTSGFLGVSWDKNMKQWRAQIKLNYKRIHIGYFHEKDEAHQAYLKKKREIHAFGEI